MPTPGEISEKETRTALAARNITGPAKAIRAFCVEICMCGSRLYTKECPSQGCPLYVYRFGKNPRRRSGFSDEQKLEIGQRLKEGREKAGIMPKRRRIVKEIIDG